MKVVRNLGVLMSAGGLLMASAVLLADDIRFSDFTPLASSAGPAADESAPITFGNPDFEQRSIANRLAQLDAGAPNSGNWDMNTVNETGPHKGRFLFTVFETGQSGVQRHDLLTGYTDTIWHSPVAGLQLGKAGAQSAFCAQGPKQVPGAGSQLGAALGAGQSAFCAHGGSHRPVAGSHSGVTAGHPVAGQAPWQRPVPEHEGVMVHDHLSSCSTA